VSWPQITEGLKQIGGAKWSVIFLMIPLQIINFLSIGKIYQSYFKNTGHKSISTGFALKVALELNFVNHVFPSGGVAGFSYLGIRFKEKGIPVARTTLAQVVRFALTFVSFLIILFFGMFLLSFGSGSSGGGVAMFIGLSIAFLTLFTLLVAIYIAGSEKRIRVFTAFLPKLINGIIKHITRKAEVINVEKIEKLFSDFHKDYLIIAKDWRQLKKPFVWALVVNLTEISTAYLAYIALGHLVNPGAVILAYSVASFAGLVAILPGGIGVYEALMTGVLASAGVPKALALSATLIYRIFTIIVFIPTGFILYQLALRQNGTELKDGARSNINAN
jgi:putative heme transporter